jgi:4'-phosphopantetheinyl transferase EntD
MKSPLPEDVAFVLRERVAGDEAAVGGALLPEERALLAPEASPKRIADFALGRVCGREALRQAGAWSGGAPPAILRHERAPVWPPGYVGSLAHTHGAAAAVAAPAARYRGLGVDVESRNRDTAGVAARILRPEEREALGGLPPEWVTVWFCVKESIYKALHPATGVYLGFQDARVHGPARRADLAAGGSGSLEWELLKACGADFPASFRGRAGWSVDERWLVAGVWLKA